MSGKTLTVGRLMFNSVVPAEFREQLGDEGDLTSRNITAVLEQVAHKRPELYKDISYRLLRLGMKGSVETNTSFTLDDLDSSLDKVAIRKKVQAEVDDVRSDPALSEKEKNEKILGVYSKYGQQLPDMVFQQAMADGSGLARMVAAGARGNKGQLNSNIGADWAVSDSQGRQIPIPITHSYSEGLTPAEYFAAAYGTRLGLIATKFSCSADTLVRMADGSVKRIEDIGFGDWVVGADRFGGTFPVRVLNRFDHGLQRCRRHSFRIHSTESLVSIDATDDHKMLAKIRAWGKASKYGVSEPTQLPLSRVVSNSARQYVAIPAQTGLEVSGRHEPYALLVGLLLGDGHAAESKNLALSCADPCLLEDIKDYLFLANFRLQKSRPDVPACNRYNLNYVETPDKKIVVDPVPGFGGKRTESGCPFREKIGEWGWFGRLAPEKVFPDEVWEWDNDSVATLIGGLFSADGSIGRAAGKSVSVRLCLTSKKMLEQVRELLQVRFGIFAAEVSEVDVSKKKWAKSRQWMLQFSHRSAVRKFLTQIPLVGRKKAQAAKLLEFLDQNPSEREENCFSWVGSEDLGEIQTYDIEVDHPDHLFVLANGLITSNSVQDGGYFAKQIGAAASDLIVTQADCGTDNGLPVAANDQENIGSVLAKDAGGFKAGTVLTPKVMDQINQANGGKKIIVRSPISCKAKGGGICSECAGVREDNRFPEIGQNVGANATSGLSMPVSQALLSTKHSAGVASAGGANQVRGFPQIESLAQVPRVFPNAATLANLDGTVDRVEEAPQGGTYVFVNHERHYIPSDREVKVKVGDTLEAGDVLSSGTPNPAEIVKHKGVGAGRAYFVDAFMKALKDNGTSADRRNTEVLSRALINHVRVADDSISTKYLPDDVVEYSAIAESYTPPADTRVAPTRSALGKYLQKPVLHYTIGSRVTPSMVKQLEDLEIGEIDISDRAPDFEPEMVRAMDNPAHKDDFMTHTGQSYVKRNLLDDVQSGTAKSNLHGKYWAPALARGVEFGRPPKDTPGY